MKDFEKISSYFFLTLLICTVPYYDLYQTAVKRFGSEINDAVKHHGLIYVNLHNEFVLTKEQP